jgi:hypothetical protein
MANDVDLDKLFTAAAYKNTSAAFDTERLDKLYTLALYQDASLAAPTTRPRRVQNVNYR